MSPDRTTITRAEAIRLRKEEEQRQREKLLHRNAPKPRLAPTPKTPAKPKAASPASNHSAAKASTSRWQHRYDIAMSTPRAKTTRTVHASKAPVISLNLPHISYGPRWLSFFIALFCFLDLYLMLNMDPFIVHNADISGNNRVTTQQIQDVLRVADQPAAYLNPEQIQLNILAAFPDISNAQVEVNIPGSVVISVVERTPVAAWQQDGQVVWVDAMGYAFPPRGKVDKLPTISAAGAPPIPVETDPSQVIGARPFLPADLSQAIETLTPSLPQGAALVFDPKYGLGWNDPKGWKVYFGHSNGDSALKLQVYKTILDDLSKKNIQPVLISVEYPNAPFYRVEQ
jgi:hypothetical protein